MVMAKYWDPEAPLQGHKGQGSAKKKIILAIQGLQRQNDAQKANLSKCSFNIDSEYKIKI